MEKTLDILGQEHKKLEEQINLLFPEATTIRMDVDTVTKKEFT